MVSSFGCGGSVIVMVRNVVRGWAVSVMVRLAMVTVSLAGLVFHPFKCGNDCFIFYRDESMTYELRVFFHPAKFICWMCEIHLSVSWFTYHPINRGKVYVEFFHPRMKKLRQFWLKLIQGWKNWVTFFNMLMCGFVYITSIEIKYNLYLDLSIIGHERGKFLLYNSELRGQLWFNGLQVS